MPGGDHAKDPQRARSGRPGPPLSGQLPDPDRLVVPDDAAELDPDLRALHREERWRRWRSRVRHLLLSRRWRTYGLSGPLVVAILLVVALIGSLASFLRPTSPAMPAAEPLAAPPAAAGEVGGLLPDAVVTLNGEPLSLRDRRPGLLMIVPEDCACQEMLDALYAQAKNERLRVDIVGSPDEEERLSAVDLATGNGAADVLLDPDGAVDGGYGGAELTVLLVAPDGVVVEILRSPEPGRRIGGLLSRMLAGDGP